MAKKKKVITDNCDGSGLLTNIQSDKDFVSCPICDDVVTIREFNKQGDAEIDGFIKVSIPQHLDRRMVDLDDKDRNTLKQHDDKNLQIMRSKKPEKSQVEIKAMTVYDADEDKFIDVNVEQQNLAWAVHNQISLNAFVMALGLKRIRDEKLYLSLGCTTMGQYGDIMSPVKRRQMYKYLKIADRFTDRFPQLKSGDISAQSENSALGALSENLSFGTLYEAAQLDGAEFEEVTESGDMGKLATELEKLKKKYTSKISQLSEDNKKLKSETKHKDSLLTEKEQELEDAQNLELKYGARASKLDDKRRCMDLARKKLADTEQWLFQVNVDEDDPTQLLQDLADLIRRLDQAHGNALANYGFIAELIDA